MVMLNYVADVNTMELRRYRFNELKKATNSFSDERLIGSGAFGKVYRGVLGDEKRTVAIKKAHSWSKESAEEFRNGWRVKSFEYFFSASI